MHWVKGVSAFLRRGSSSNNAGERVDHQGENSMPPTSWPEVQFRNDGEEALVESLWQGYQEALGQEETQKALEAFLVCFVKTFKNWVPTEPPHAAVTGLVHSGKIEGSSSEFNEPVVSVNEGTVLGCTQGHPTKIIVGLVEELKGVIRSFTALHANPDGNSDVSLDPSNMQTTLHLLEVLNILTRSFHNRRIFSFLGGLQSLMGVMKAAVVELKGIASVVISESTTPASALTQLDFLQGLLTHVVSIVANYNDAQEIAGKIGVPVAGLQQNISQRTIWGIGNSTVKYGPMPSKSRQTIQRHTAVADGTLGSSPDSNVSDRPGISNGSVPLLEIGGLNWFVELLRVLQKLRLRGAMLDTTLEQLVLHTLRATIVANPYTQNHFRSIGGLEVLLDGIQTLPMEVCGTKDYTLTDNNSTNQQVDLAHTVEIPSLSKLAEGFQLKLLCFQVLRESILWNGASLQYMQDYGGVQRFAEVIRWAAFIYPEVAADSLHSSANPTASPSREQTIFSINSILDVHDSSRQKSHSPDVPSRQATGHDGKEDPVDDGDNLQGWNWRVKELCQILFSFLMPSGDISSIVRVLQRGPQGFGISLVYWELATRCIVNVLLGVFRGGGNKSYTTNGLHPSRLLSSTLQHYVLYVFKKMLEGAPTVLIFFRESGVWEVMFSEYFFYFGLAGLEIPAYKEVQQPRKKGPSVKATWVHPKATGSHASSATLKKLSDLDLTLQIPDFEDAEPLRVGVISFIEFAATGTGVADNMPECSALMEALQECSFFPSLATMLAKSLHRILQLAVEPTISAFKKLDATSRLALVMEGQTQASAKIVKENSLNGKGKSSLQELLNKELWPQAREAVFGLFEEYFAMCEEAVGDASRNIKALDALFNLLWESSTRPFALRQILQLMKVAPTTRDEKMNLCRMYLESFQRAQLESQNNTDIGILFELLAGMRDVLQTDITDSEAHVSCCFVQYYQDLFREGECFLHIVTLLSKDLTKEAGSQLCLDVIVTLIVLLKGNTASKVYFRELEGYKNLQTLLIERHGGRPTRMLLFELLNMMVDGSFEIPNNMLILNVDVVVLFFNILQHCEEQDQLNGLDTFHQLLKESTANRAACVRAGLLTVLLDWFAMEHKESVVVKLVQIMQIIGGHSTSGKEMRIIVSLLRSTKDGFRPRHGILLLQILRGMLKEQSPAVFFELSGKDSGIVVTPELRWPVHRGFSFCCWVRVERFPASSLQAAEEGMMGLFSFLSENGKGFTTLLSHNQLIFESISQKHLMLPLRVTLQLKQWYFLCITHTTGGALTGGNSLKVFLDGELVASGKLKYQRVHENLTMCTIGASVPLSSIVSNESQPLSGRYSAPFCGQLGPVYLFEDPLSADQVMGVYSLGPSYMYSFLPREVGCVPENVSTQCIINEKDGLASKMIFGYNAQASAGRMLFDISPIVEHSPDPVLHDATTMVGTLLCYRHLVQDSVQCIGGIGVFFPLLTQLDQPVCEVSQIPDSLSESPEVKQHEDNSYPIASLVAVEVIELITALLAGNYANLQHMHNIAGMSVLGFLLQSVSPQHLTVKVVAALQHMLTTVAKANGAFLSKALVKEVLLKIYLNPHIWIFAPFIVQQELFMSLIHYFEDDNSLLPSVCGLPRILDMLRQFFWDKPKSRRAFGTKPLVHPVTKAIIGERPNQFEVGELRSLILVLAEGYLREHMTIADTRALVAFLEMSEDIICVQDVLYMLVGLLGQKSFVLPFAEHVTTLGGPQIFLNLLKWHQEIVRMLGLRLIGAVLVTTFEKKDGGISFLGTSRAASQLQRTEKQKLNHVFSNVADSVMMFPFTDVVRATLFDILLGEASHTQVLQDRSTKGDGSGTARESIHESLSLHLHKIFRGSHKPPKRAGAFVLPQMLRIIFKLMVSCNDSMLRLEILKDTLGLLEANPLNSEALTLEPTWQDWLFEPLVAAMERSKKNMGDSVEDVLWMIGPEEVLIRKLICTYHVHCVCTSKGGWLHVERTLNYVHMYGDKGYLSTFHTLHVLLGDLFEAMVQGLPLQASLFTQPCRDNTLYLLALVDELVMRDAFRILPQFLPSSDAFTDETMKVNLSGGHADLGSDVVSGLKSGELSPEEGGTSGVQDFRKELSGDQKSWQIQTSTGDVVKLVNKDQFWRLYDNVWSLLIAMNGRGTASGSFQLSAASSPTLGQRARGLVESLNMPAAEMAVAVVSSGLGVVGISSSLNKQQGEKTSRLRGERCPRVVFRLVLLYLYHADLESTSRCVQQFLALLPVFLSTESEQNKNRLQLLLWTLLDARVHVGFKDHGARLHVVSQLIQETVESGKTMLANSLPDKESNWEESTTSSVHKLLQQERVVAAIAEEARYLKGATAQRVHEVEALCNELKEASLLELGQRNALDEQSQTALSSICTNDRNRRGAVQVAYDEEQQAVSEQWCHMFRDLTDERGPWSTATSTSGPLIRWKLDKTEDPWRRRLKLKRNYHFDNDLLHPISGAPSSPAVDLVNETGGTLMEGVRTFLLKGLRAVADESPSDEEDGKKATDSEMEMELASTEEYEDGGHLPDQGGSASRGNDITREQQEVTATEDSGEDEVLLSVSCVLVAPKRKLAGHLEVMRSSIHFHGEFVVEGTGGQSVFSSSGGLNYPEVTSIEKSSSKSKGNSRREEVADMEKVNVMERLEPMHHSAMRGGPWKDIKRHGRWDLCQVKTVHLTRYLLQNSALEIFFHSAVPPAFLNFSSQNLAKDIGMMIVDLYNGLGMGKSGSKSRGDMIELVDKRKAIERAEKAREQWRRRNMSNFDYLMTLNTLAGRSYNDMTQYPVFPWVVADYSSESLDLSNSQTFRDLAKPVGALDPNRLQVFEERYHSFTDPDIPSFYYGSHYSSMGIVLFYLLRLEPFTSLHRHLQGGKFDHADRLFHSIASVYQNCLTNTSDVKELIPEFYYLPEFLHNSNGYFLGIKQDSEQLGDVILPTWAKGSAEIFVQKNREALESEYVSEHLHEWIDLIFGYKQRGRPAVEIFNKPFEEACELERRPWRMTLDHLWWRQAANVFYHLTYEGAVDIHAMENSLERAAVEDQIANFGQTPIQLFRKKHQKRGPAVPVARPLYYAPASIMMTSFISSAQSSAPGQKATSIIFVGLIDGLVVTVNESLTVMARAWITPALRNFTFSSSQDFYFGIGSDIVLTRKLGWPFANDVLVNPGFFGTLQVCSSPFLLTCGHWDNSFKVVSLENGDMIQSIYQHKDIITCLSVGIDGSVVVTGSRDTTAMVWDIELATGSMARQAGKHIHEDRRRKAETIAIADKPRHILCGHDDAVTCIAVRVELDIVVSGSKDATCIFHTLREGRYVRSVRHPNECAITKLAVSQHGMVVVYSNDDLSLHVYSINGKWLAMAYCKGQLNCMEVSHCGEFLVCGGDQGQVVVYIIQTLEVVRRYDGTGVSISSLTVTPEDCFLVGAQDGSLMVFSLEFQQQNKKGGLLASYQRHAR